MKKIQYILLLLSSGVVLNAQEYLSLERTRQLALEKSEDLRIAEKTLEKTKDEKAALRTNYLPKVLGSVSSVYLKDDYTTELYLPTSTPDPATGELVPNIMYNPGGAPVIGSDGNPVFNMYAFMPIDLSLQGAYMAGVKLQQPVYTGGMIKAGNKMAEIGMEMAGQNLQLKKMEAIVEADQAYWMFVSVNSKVKLAEQSVEMLKELVERVENSFETGMVNRNELLKVQVQYNKATLDLQKAESGLELTRLSLCRVTGLDNQTQIIADTSIVLSSEEMPVTGNEDVAKRTEYDILLKDVKLAEQQMKLARSEFLPTVGIQAGYNYIGGIEFNGSAMNQDNISVMASVQIPIFHWGEGIHKVNSAKKEIQMKELKLEKNKGLLQLEIDKARLNLRDAYYRVEISESALEQASENLRISKDNYELGNELITDLLIAQTQWQVASTDLLEAKTDFKIQETEYLRVTSRLISIADQFILQPEPE
jgi:outer membrane protein TolC